MGDTKKDNWGRSKQTIWRLYGKERCIKEWGNTLPSPADIQEYKQNWIKKALDANQFFKCIPYANTIKISNEESKSIIKLLELLENHEDIQKLYSNFEVS